MSFESKGLRERGKIFKIFSSSLRIMYQNNLIPSWIDYVEDSYICPICLKCFSIDYISTSSSNMLTLEDAPPKKLGGKANVLTCKQCNNFCGYSIDKHLVHRIKDIDTRSFKSASSNIKVRKNELETKGILKINETGELKIQHSIRNNHPERLINFISSISKDDTIEIEFITQKINIHLLEVAILKTAYILAFEKFGYALIFNESYNIVREQILNPTEKKYPKGFWTIQSSFDKQSTGTYLINNNKYQGIYSIFELSYNHSSVFIGAYLPVKIELTDYIVFLLRNIEPGFKLQLDKFMNIDLINNEYNLLNFYYVLNYL